MSALARLQELLDTGPGLVTVLLLLVVALVSVGSLRGRGHVRAGSWLAAVGLLVAVTVVLGLTLRPTAAPHEAVRTFYLDPREGIRAAANLHIVWGPVIDNVALFVPVGALASAVFRRHALAGVWLGCVLLSVMIETAQFLAPIGRIANSADVVANAAGAALGAAVAVVSRSRRRPRSEVRTASGAARI